MFEIQTVNTSDEIRDVAMLAHEIWNQHFADIIGQDQVDYMLGEFQSPSAIMSQISTGSEYFLALSCNKDCKDKVGYFGIVSDVEESRLMISKIYIREKNRGQGLGDYLLEFIKSVCFKRNLKTIWLTVNRFNNDTIDWYKRKGFVVVDEVKKDIGSGFFMDDYIMELTVG